MNNPLMRAFEENNYVFPPELSIINPTNATIPDLHHALLREIQFFIESTSQDFGDFVGGGDTHALYKSVLGIMLPSTQEPRLFYKSPLVISK